MSQKKLMALLILFAPFFLGSVLGAAVTYHAMTPTEMDQAEASRLISQHCGEELTGDLMTVDHKWKSFTVMVARCYPNLQFEFRVPTNEELELMQNDGG